MENTNTPPAPQQSSKVLWVIVGVIALMALVALFLSGRSLLQTDLISIEGSPITLSTDRTVYRYESGSGSVLSVDVAVDGVDARHPLLGLKVVLEGVPPEITIQDSDIVAADGVRIGERRAERVGDWLVIILIDMNVETPGMIMSLRLHLPTEGLSAPSLVRVVSDPAEDTASFSPQSAIATTDDAGGYVSRVLNEGVLFRLTQSIPTCPSVTGCDALTVVDGCQVCSGSGGLLGMCPFCPEGKRVAVCPVSEEDGYGYTCVSGDPDTVVTNDCVLCPTSTPSCAVLDYACQSDGDCCSGKCGGTEGSKRCMPDTSPTPSCAEFDYACTEDGDCCSNVCAVVARNEQGVPVARRCVSSISTPIPRYTTRFGETFGDASPLITLRTEDSYRAYRGGIMPVTISVDGISDGRILTDTRLVLIGVPDYLTLETYLVEAGPGVNTAHIVVNKKEDKYIVVMYGFTMPASGELARLNFKISSGTLPADISSVRLFNESDDNGLLHSEVFTRTPDGVTRGDRVRPADSFIIVPLDSEAPPSCAEFDYACTEDGDCCSGTCAETTGSGATVGIKRCIAEVTPTPTPSSSPLSTGWTPAKRFNVFATLPSDRALEPNRPYNISVCAVGDSGVDHSYLGRIQFRLPGDSSPFHEMTTPRVAVPYPYTFTPEDWGCHTFRDGITFLSSGTFAVRVQDQSDPSIYGVASFEVTCGNGICQPPLERASNCPSDCSSSPTSSPIFSPSPTPGSSLLPSRFIIHPLADVWPNIPSRFQICALDQYGETLPTYTGMVLMFSPSSSVLIPYAHDGYVFTAEDRGCHVFDGFVFSRLGVEFVSVVDIDRPDIFGHAFVVVRPGFPSPTPPYTPMPTGPTPSPTPPYTPMPTGPTPPYTPMPTGPTPLCLPNGIFCSGSEIPCCSGVCTPPPGGASAVCVSAPTPTPLACEERKGDVNCDGRVNIADLAYLADVLAGKAPLSTEQSVNANVADVPPRDVGRVRLNDLVKLADFVAGFVPSL